MPYGDVTEAALALDAQYGSASSSVMPTSNDIALFMGGPPSPYGTGTEADYPGYARATVNNADWPDADTSDATKTLTVDFPDATDAASDDIDCWVMYNATAIVAYAFLDEPVAVDGVMSGISGDVILFNPNDANVVD